MKAGRMAVGAWVVALLTSVPAMANVFSMGAGLTSVEFVTVGNPGNPGEWAGESYGGSGRDKIVGQVASTFNIGKFETTAAQYTEFLNAVARTDPYHLYNPEMWSEPEGCKISRFIDPGSGLKYYSVAPEWANRPVNFVDWGDAARFCNWLTNGQPTGAQDLSTTEDGSYYLNGATGYDGLEGIWRAENPRYVLPSENEWYKAAYHKNDPGAPGGNYWDYPTGTDAPPNNDLVHPDAGNNANFYEVGFTSLTIGPPYYRTEPGEFENSESPYGTFDQGGNVWEWTDKMYYLAGGAGTCRVIKGGSYSDALGGSGPAHLKAPIRKAYFPERDFEFVGFRVGEVLRLGDATMDGCVDGLDYTQWSNHYHQSGNWQGGDFTGDGYVDGLDYIVWSQNFHQGCPGQPGAVPEPGVLLLLGLGGLALIRRRR